MDIQPIETRYKGYRFRSRLEARWAVFFDVLGILYEYEREGYRLTSGLYLPDFWLPQVHMWAEVKPQVLTHEEITLARELAAATKHDVLMLIGPPGWYTYSSVSASGLDTDYIVGPEYLDENRFFGCMHGWSPDRQPLNQAHAPSMRDAILAANSARFEFGDEGADRA
jgi:hypothetical protein